MTPQIDQFVPLVSAVPSTEKREFQITVVPQGTQSQPFKLLETTANGAERPAFKRNCEPRLSVQRDQERITHIRIECSCGQTIDLACVYDEPARPAKPVAPVTPAKPVAPTLPAEPAESTEPPKPTVTAKAAKPARAAKSAKP